MMDIRTITCASLEPIKGREYIIGVDVAKSKNAKNNNTIMVVLGFTRHKDNSIKNIYMEYMKKVTSSGTYTAQSLELKRLYETFKPKAIVVDAQSYGQGFIEACSKAEIDPLTNKETVKFATFNEEGEYGVDIVGHDAIPIIYALKSSHAIETQIIVNFQGWIQSNRFHIPCANNSIDFPKESHKDEKMKMEIETVHLNVSNFIEEVANLKAEKLDNGKLKIKMIVRADKDRYSATTYSLFYLNKFENIVDNASKVDLSTRQRCVTSMKF
jgi:glutathione peroxidase-family protein